MPAPVRSVSDDERLKMNDFKPNRVCKALKKFESEISTA